MTYQVTGCSASVPRAPTLCADSAKGAIERVAATRNLIGISGTIIITSDGVAVTVAELQRRANQGE